MFHCIKSFLLGVHNISKWMLIDIYCVYTKVTKPYILGFTKFLH